MRFSEDGICELDSITTVDECEAYRDFLWQERARHEDALAESLKNAEYQEVLARQDWETRTHKARWIGVPSSPEYQLGVAAFERSAVKRHQQDLDGIIKRIKEIEAHRATLEVE